MNLLQRLKDHPDPISEKKFAWLGNARGHSYGQFDGREYAVLSTSLDPAEHKRQPGELFVSRERDLRLSDGALWPKRVYNLAVPVASGTFDKISAGTKAAKEQAPRVWDALSEYRRTGSDVRRIPLPTPGSIDMGAMKAAIGGGGYAPWLERPAGGLDDSTPAGVVRYLSARGISLTLGRGRLIARSAAPINVMDRQLIDRAEQLIIGELGGSKPLCSECSEPATTIVIPRAPICAEHAR